MSGPVDIKEPLFVKTVHVESAGDMFEAVTAASGEQDAIIKAAAVADYRPRNVSTEKVKKSEDQLTIDLERTEDILGWLDVYKRQDYECEKRVSVSRHCSSVLCRFLCHEQQCI